MSPFKVLGLTRRASLLEVKRAYAQLLKKHRPDEDPVGFQRILVPAAPQALHPGLPHVGHREVGVERRGEVERLPAFSTTA